MTEDDRLKMTGGKFDINRNFIGEAYDAGVVRYTPNKWRAIEMFTESSVNMIVLMSNYVTQSAMTDMYGFLTTDKKVFRHMVKVHARNAKDVIDASVEKCITKNRDNAQANYLFTYSDFMDDKMRPKVRQIKSALEKILEERGCRKPNMCAWVLTCEGFARMSCNLYISIMAEIKEMFRCDMTQRFLEYYMGPCYNELRALVQELEKLYPEMKGIDAQNTPDTAPIFDAIDDDIRNAESLDEAADEANAEFDEERRQKNMERVQRILAEIGTELDEHKERYSAG